MSQLEGRWVELSVKYHTFQPSVNRDLRETDMLYFVTYIGNKKMKKARSVVTQVDSDILSFSFALCSALNPRITSASFSISEIRIHY